MSMLRRACSRRSHVPDGAGAGRRIFVGRSLLFDGGIDGGSRVMIDGWMSGGHVGRHVGRSDADDRLHVEGRDDEMIVSGGENVFPQEVEDCLAGRPAVVEAGALGVDDPDFGTRLRAFVPELPRNATGGILRRELASWDAQG